MGLGDFWLQSNSNNRGKKFSLKDLRNLKPEDIAQNPKLQKLINLFDSDGSGNLEINELQSVFSELKSAAKDDILSDNELGLYLSNKFKDKDITVEDIKELLNVVADKQTQELNYTDLSGNNISDKYENGEIIERTITSQDDQGNKVEVSVFFENKKPVKQLKTINNEVAATITYDYSSDPENPTTVTIFKDKDGVVEEVNSPDKRTLTLYKTNSIDDFDKTKSKRQQQVVVTDNAQYVAEYDGKGNTLIIVQNSETPELIAQKFGIKLSDLGVNNKGVNKNTTLQAGQKLVIPGEFDADNKVMKPRKTEGEVKQQAAQHAFGKVFDKIFASALDEYEIKPENAGKDVYEYAEKSLLRKGAKKTDKNFNTKLNDLANELIALNGKDAKYTAGSKIRYVKKTLNKETVNQLKDVGMTPSQENHIFFARFNYLTPQQQTNVIDVLKQCKAKGITEPQKINAEILKYYPEIQLFETDVKVLQKPTKAMARSYIAHYLLEQIDAITALYNQTATSDKSLWTLGTGLVVELQDLLHISTKFINDTLGTIIPEGDSRVNLGKLLKKLKDECLSLVVLADMEEKSQDESFDKKKNIPDWEGSRFDKKFNELFNGTSMDYDAVITYLQAVQEFQKAPEKDRNNQNSKAYKKIEAATNKLNSKLPAFENIAKRIEGWSSGTQVAGGLTDLGIQVALLYLSGGSSAIARSSMYVGNATRFSVGSAMSRMTASRLGSTAVGRFLVKDGTQFITKEGSAILASMVTSSAETAAFFQSTKIAGALEDGKVTGEEVAVINEAFEGLFKFSMVGSALAGPLGAKASELTSKLLNSEKAIASTMKMAVEGNGTTLDKVLKALCENSDAVSKITEFGTSFSLNSAYLMYDENEQIRKYNSTVEDESLKQEETGYLGAMGNMAQMDAVSKLVVAMLGGKNTAFLTPKKVQQIKTSLAGYEVKLSVYKGQKIYEVTDKAGTKTRLANEQELFLFIIDREIAELTRPEANIPEISTENSELRKKARTENPAVVAEPKVREEWQQHDIDTGVNEGETGRIDLFNLDTEAGLKEPVSENYNEVTDLILKGKLGETLTRKYEHANEVFKEILDKHRDDIEELANKYRYNNGAYAQGLIDILLKEFGMEEVELKARRVARIGGGCNWHEGTIDISEMIDDKNELAELITHEFVHLLQFREVLAEQGIKGLQQLINDNKAMEPWEKQILIQQINSNPKFFIQMLSNVKGQQSEVGSINYYLRKIYQKETANPKHGDDGEAYFNELIEREAYRLGSNGHNLDIKLKELSPEEAEKLKEENNDFVSDNGILKFWNPNQGKFEFPNYEPAETKTESETISPKPKTNAPDAKDPKEIIFENKNEIKLPSIKALTGKETLETLLKVKEESEKILEQIIKDHENYPKEKHSLGERMEEGRKFLEIKFAYENYQKSLDTAIKLAERIKYEESQSKVEKEFKTIENTQAAAVLKEALIVNEEQKEWCSDRLVKSCMIDDKVSEELVNLTIEILKKDSGDLYDIMHLVELFKNKSGIDRAAIEVYKELSKGKYNGKNNPIAKIIEACKDENKKFRYDYYEKAKLFLTGAKYDPTWIKNILSDCEDIHVLPDSQHSYKYIDEKLIEKALELKEMGFDTYDIHSLMAFCRCTSEFGYKEKGDFSQERFELIRELKDKYNISVENINSILNTCCNNDGVFDRAKYIAAVGLKNHVADVDIDGGIIYYTQIEDKEAALRNIDELQQKYGVKSKRVMFLYVKCCDKVEKEDGAVVYRFNPQKYEKAVELKTKYNVKDFDTEDYIKTCTVNGKFEEDIYNKILEYRNKYGFDDDILYNLIRSCIHAGPKEQSWEGTIIDYKLMDKIGIWTDKFIKQLSEEDTEKLKTNKESIINNIGTRIDNILDKIESLDCNAIEYIEKFIDAGIEKIPTRLIEAMVLDENGFRVVPAHYDTVVLDAMIEWASKYHLTDERISTVMWRITHQKNLSKEDAIKYINQLYDAGWHPNNTDSFRAILHHWGHDNHEFDIDAINLFTEYLKKGHTASTIEAALYSCAQKGEPHTEEYYVVDREKFDRLLQMAKYCPKEKQAESTLWMRHFTDWYESMVGILKDGKIPFKDFYDFAWNKLCNVEMMDNPKNKALIPVILEKINQNQEYYDDIKDIVTNYYGKNKKFLDFCFNHLENREWAKCFEVFDNSEYYGHYSFQEFIDILSILDTKEFPVGTEIGRIGMAQYADAICSNLSRYLGDGVNKGQYCPEVIEKIKEFMISGELSSILRSIYGSTIVFDNPDFCNVLDALANAERDGLDEDLICAAYFKIRGGEEKRDNNFAENYQEIIDFYIKNQDVVNKDNAEVYKLIRNLETQDVQLLEKTLEYCKKINSPEIIKIISNICKGDIKPFLDFFDKVDFEKYGNEVKSLLSQMDNITYETNYRNKKLLFSSKLSKENIEFILDIEKLFNETTWARPADNIYSLSASEIRPYLTNDFFKIFVDGEIPEEALNKLRFYIENQVSIAKENPNEYSSRVKMDEITNLINIYKLRPDKIEFFEDYLFGNDGNKREFAKALANNLSKDKEILDKQFELLDDILSYDNAIESRYRIQEIFEESNNIAILDNINAKTEAWDLIKPKDKKPKKGVLSDKLYLIGYVKSTNKDAIIAAYNKNFGGKIEDIALLSDNIHAKNESLIIDMINSEKYSPDFIKNLADNTFLDAQVEMARDLLKNGTFTEEQMECIIIYLRESSYNLARELCFNKEINFQKDIISRILSDYTETTQDLAWKLCTSKVRSIPEDKIPLAMRCYASKKYYTNNIEINMDMYINKFKMFLDLDFSEKFIKEILGTSGGSLARYTRNFCAVLQHLQQKGAKAEKCVGMLTTDTISSDLTRNIEILEVLNMLDGDDIKLLQADGIDIYNKIKKLQNAINVKHPIIEVQKGEEVGTLKVLANNGNAEKTIQEMDLTQFEGKDGKPAGIPLEYTREEFMQRMNRLIAEYSSGKSDKKSDYNAFDNTEIPDLKLSEEAQEKVRQEIERFKQVFRNRCQDEDIIMDGKTCHGIHFINSKTSGSNPGDYYLIDGKLYYVKTPTSDKLGQSIEEVIASRLYRAAGIDAPNEHYIFNDKGKVIGMASEYIPDMETRQWSSVSEAEARLMFDSFAVDAWLADWDAPKNDNTQIYDNGKIIKSDVGGSMRYRAKGEIKEEFNGTVIELLTLIENNSILYSKMTKQDILKSIKQVLDIPDATIYQTIMQSPSRNAKLAETMIRRKDYMQKFYENLEKLDDKDQNIIDLIIEAQGKTVAECREIPDIAGSFGYIPTEKGFEGLLNTQGFEKLILTPEQQEIANKMKAEIERFTLHNRLADSADVPEEVRTFVNRILKGLPEFASYFGKPQHGNGSVDANGKQISGHQYSLDIHILNVLQKSLNNPLYNKVDEYGFKLLDDESKLVLKFSALLHDIGKMHLNGKDEGHAERSAEYVYSILNRFNLPKRVKNRIINIVNNHHWYEKLCKGVISEEEVAATFRTTADFTIARIIAQADIESVYEGYFTDRMKENFPDEVTNEKSAHKKFNSMMDNIQQKVTQIEETSAVVTPSKFVEVPEHIGSDGKVVPRRGFPIVEIELDGKVEQFRVLNLNDLDPETDMYQYGFNHIKLKDLKLLVHRFGDGEWGKFTTTKILGDNPSRYSVQSLSLISPDHAAAYGGRKFACIMESNNANIGVAYYRNAGTGTWKNLSNLVEELFDPHYENRRNFFKKEFLKRMKEKDITISDSEYGVIMRYVRNKQYIETQLKDLNLGSKTIKREDLADALLYSQQRLIDKQKYENRETHNEETEIDCKVIAGGGSIKTMEELEGVPEFLRLCRDNCNGNIILW